MAILLLASCLALAPQDSEHIQKLIATLGDPSKEERDKAVKDLVAAGRPALDALRKATSSSDSEVKALAAQAIEKIEWGGVDRLKAYAKENLDEGATVEPSKIKAFSRWFPEARLYEVTGGAPAAGGVAAMMGMQAPKSLFAVRKYENGFHRLMVKGIYCGSSIRALISKEKIVLANEEAALDFALAFIEIYTAGLSQNATAVMLSGGASRLEKVAEGWSLDSAGYGANVIFKVDGEGRLLDVVQSSGVLNAWGLQAGDRKSEERTRLELDKLKLEIEILKRQLEKK